MFGTTFEFDTTELNATFKSAVVFCRITVEFDCIWFDVAEVRPLN